MARRTKEEAEATRSEILDAAERRFERFGVARTTLDEIAREAGVTRGAVYHHFGNKVDIFEAMQARARLPQEDVLDCLLASDPDDPLSALRDACKEALMAIAVDDRRRRVYTILMHRCEYVEEMAVTAERKRANVERMQNQSRALFEAAADKGLLSPAWQPALAAAALHNLMSGTLSTLLEQPIEPASLSLALGILDAFFASLGRIPAPAAAQA